MIEVISIHIPKTAGRSLLSVLRQVYGDEGVLVVNRKLFRQSPEAGLADLRKRVMPAIKAIHGHVHYSDIRPVLDENPQAKLITFLREPIQRVTSHFYYEHKILQERGRVSGVKEVDVENLTAYLNHPESQNVIHRFIGDAPAERFFFIGNFESFSNDIHKLGGLMHWPDFTVPRENVNAAKASQRAPLTETERVLASEKNSLDIALYNQLKLHGVVSKPPRIRCWIASFPRSGNTFFRNILYYVYGIESGTWHKETAFPVDDDYDQYDFVKTHLLPHELVPHDPSVPAIYLVRDGRDAMVSIAHHRSNLVEPGSDLVANMKEAIVAAEGSFFGGWSKNVNQWMNRAQLVIRYEDLVENPEAVMERVGKIVSLPSPDWSKLPSFDELKKGKPMYGGTSKLPDPKFNPDEFAAKFFRKGKAGNWKEEMPADVQDLFWNYHGDTMERLGYEVHTGSVGQNTTLDFLAMKRMGNLPAAITEKKYHVLIESSKLTQPGNDGIKRYLVELLKGFEDVTNNGDPRWSFELLIGRRFLPLSSYRQMLRLEADELHDYEKVLMAFKRFVQKVLPDPVYKSGSSIYKKTDVRKVLKKIQQRRSVTKELEFYRELELKKAHVDLLHIPLPQNSEHLKSLSHNFVVTVHDMTHFLYPQHHEDSNIKLAEQGMKFITDKQAHVIAVSKSTVNDIIQTQNIPESHIHLAYECPDKDLFKWNVNPKLASAIRSKYKLGATPYFLCLSTIEPRKNLPNTIRAFNKFIAENPNADVNLVISGSFGWKTEHLRKELHLDHSRIIFTGFADDVDLPVLYSEAIALCYVSVYEGFGLPPIEAMSCRTPVIYGNNSSLVEVIGEAGLAANADDVDAIKQRMHQMFYDTALRNLLAVKSHLRSFEFSWRKNIFDTLKIYEQVIEDKTGNAN